jgi:hypothetical protein
VIATVDHPPINLDASNITVRLGDLSLPTNAEFPAWMALARYLDGTLGPIETGK